MTSQTLVLRVTYADRSEGEIRLVNFNSDEALIFAKGLQSMSMYCFERGRYDYDLDFGHEYLVDHWDISEVSFEGHIPKGRLLEAQINRLVDEISELV